MRKSIALALGSALLLGACGDSGDKKPASPPSPPPAAGPEPAMSTPSEPAMAPAAEPAAKWTGTLEKMQQSAAKFDTEKVRPQDLASAGGPPPTEE